MSIRRLYLSPSPHMHSGKTTQLAWGVCASLLLKGTAVYSSALMYSSLPW